MDGFIIPNYIYRFLLAKYEGVPPVPSVWVGGFSLVKYVDGFKCVGGITPSKGIITCGMLQQLWTHHGLASTLNRTYEPIVHIKRYSLISVNLNMNIELKSNSLPDYFLPI